MTAIGRIILFAALLSAGTGCGDRFVFVGTWKGISHAPVAPGTPEDVATSVRSIRLTIDANGRFDLFAGGVSLAGPAHLSANEAILEPDTYMGMPLRAQPGEVRQTDRTATLKANADGTITFNQAAIGEVVLKRESQPGT